MKKNLVILCCVAALPTPLSAADNFGYRWTEKEIDTIEIGYGLQLTDVDGDGKTDILLADKSTVQWYQNPTWEKHIIARDLTVRDNVCVTARDIDGDGKCEIVVGGQWNFRETLKDGAVTYLIAPEDRTQMWTPVALPHEPNVHRMHWILGADGKHSFVVKPLRGRGSVEGVGPGLKMLEYTVPADPKVVGDWKTSLVSDFLHLSHNFHVVNWDADTEEEMIVAAKEGVWHFDRKADGSGWKATQLTRAFAGELRDGKLPGGRRFIVTVEPMHGTKAAVYLEPEEGFDQGIWEESAALSALLVDGHALAVADYLDVGSDQIVVGWRSMNHGGPKGSTPPPPGIKYFAPMDNSGTKWHDVYVSGGDVAVEDIKAADLNGDGRADIVAAARQTKNLKIYFSEP